MTEIKKGYDSLLAREKCDFCESVIESPDKIVVGTGNSLVLSYHPHCWELMILALAEDIKTRSSVTSFTPTSGRAGA